MAIALTHSNLSAGDVIERAWEQHPRKGKGGQHTGAQAHTCVGKGMPPREVDVSLPTHTRARTHCHPPIHLPLKVDLVHLMLRSLHTPSFEVALEQGGAEFSLHAHQLQPCGATSVAARVCQSFHSVFPSESMSGKEESWGRMCRSRNLRCPLNLFNMSHFGVSCPWFCTSGGR